MNADLAHFLAPRTPLATDSVVWGEGKTAPRMTFRIEAYIDDQTPPLPYVTSVRGLIFQGESLLVVRNPDGLHIWPGGRREQGETQDQTLRREMLEETGWAITDALQLGFVHFHNLTPVPPEYAYPYPDFLHVIYVAEADMLMPEAKLEDDYELESELRPLAEVKALTLTPGERLFLQGALRLRLNLKS